MKEIRKWLVLEEVTYPPEPGEDLTGVMIEPGSVVEVRPEVARFAIEMEKVLRDNDWKGGWKHDSLDFFRKKLLEEYSELQEELHAVEMDRINSLKPVNQANVLREAADVANIAMMIADNWGELLK